MRFIRRQLRWILQHDVEPRQVRIVALAPATCRLQHASGQLSIPGQALPSVERIVEKDHVVPREDRRTARAVLEHAVNVGGPDRTTVAPTIH